MDKRARGSEWALGLQGWCREGPAGWSGAGPGRTAGTGEAVGSVERMEARGRGGQGCCQTLTSFAVSSHDGVSAVEPDAADDRELGIRPVQPLIVIIHGQAWGDSAVRPRLPASGRGDAELSPCGDRPTPFPQPPPIALLEKLRLPIRGSCPLPSFRVTSSHPPLPRPARRRHRPVGHWMLSCTSVSRSVPSIAAVSILGWFPQSDQYMVLGREKA